MRAPEYRWILVLACSVLVARVLYWLVDQFAWGEWAALAVLGGVGVWPFAMLFVRKSRRSRADPREYKWLAPFGDSTLPR
jgi:hypothetical protein